MRKGAVGTVLYCLSVGSDIFRCARAFLFAVQRAKAEKAVKAVKILFVAGIKFTFPVFKIHIVVHSTPRTVCTI